MVILVDRFNLSDNIFEIIFATPQQKIVAEVLISYMKERGGEITKSDMSFIATQLHEGKYVTQIKDPAYKGKKVKLSYNKRQFYDRILTPMRGMGLIDYDLYKKTYKVSTKFRELMEKIGAKWTEEVRKILKKKL